jgi:hypothetical protein
MHFRRLALIAILQLATGWAHACLFATSTPPDGWYRWASILVAADVTEIGKEAGKPADVITARVVETFKGPEGPEGTITVSVPSRHWASCKLEVPKVGARVLVALNPNSDAMLVPLSAKLAEGLREHKPKGAK